MNPAEILDTHVVLAPQQVASVLQLVPVTRWTVPAAAVRAYIGGAS